MSFRIKNLILVTAALVFFSSSIIALVSRWFYPQSYYSQGPLVAAAFFWLLYKRYRETESDIKLSPLPGFAVILFAVIMDLSGKISGIHTLQYFAVYAFVAGGTVFYLGRSFFTRNFMLFIYLLLAVPLPGFFLDSATFSMKIFSAGVSELLLSLIYPSIERFGSMIYINNYYIEVTPACSGMENIFSMTALLWFLALIQKRRIIAWIDYAISVPLAVLSNILRIITVSLLTVNGYGKFAFEDFHEGIGIVIFLIILVPVSLFNEISFRLPEKQVIAPYNRKNLIPYILCMSALAVITVFFHMTGGEQGTDNSPLKKEFIAKETPGWNSIDEPLSGSYYTMLRTDDILMRQYIRNGSSGEEGKVYLYFVHAKGDRAPFLHRPELCLTGEGYNLIEENDFLINALPARRMLFSRNGKGLLVYYWYRFNGREIGNYVELQKKLITQLNGDYSCMMLRLSRVVDMSGIETGEKILLDFAEKEMGLILKNL